MELNNGYDKEKSFSIEVLPPLKGSGTERLFANIDKLCQYGPRYINITTHHSEYVYRETDGGHYERLRIRRRPGTIAIAANSLAITVESLCYMPGYGIAEAATTLVGQGIGAGQKLLTRSFARMSVALGIAVMTFMGILMWCFAPELMGIMSPVEEVIAQGTQVLRIEAWAEPMFAAAIVCNGVFIGAGDTMIPAVMSLCSMWFVRLTLAAGLAPKFGLKGVWTAMAIELTFRGTIFLVRLFKGRWVEKLKLKMEN